MKIEKDRVVIMDYTLKDDAGNILDSSDGNEPLSFIFGNGMIIPGLEKALEEKIKGDTLSVSVAPEEAYGEFNEELIFSVPKTEFQNPNELQAGMQFQAKTEQGMRLFQILEVEEESVKLNGNHPLAGKTLHFDVTIQDVREATKEELDHGHSH